jgi:hypothetical protein
MNTIQINYDLVAPGRNYDRLFDYIKSHGTYAKPLKSMWFIRTTKTATQVRDEIQQQVDSNDQVVVVDVTDCMWATTFSDGHTQWMHSQMQVSALRAA